VFKEKSFSYIPLFDAGKKKAYHKHHILWEEPDLKLKDVEGRLVHKYQ
jgi:hypothetical protein